MTDPGGNEVPMQPLQAFTQCPFPQALQQEIQKAGFTKPSQIQAYAWPIALQGHDVIGIAATGSGKTIAFLFPAFMHILNHRLTGRDPALLVLAPTRELAVQIEKESVRFGASSNIRTVCAYGGAPKGQQLSQMRGGCHCLIATPGRLNDFLEGRQIKLDQVSKLVLDEADRMLDMGFEPQIRKILKEVPTKRHTLFFTATWPKEVRKLADDFLYKPYQVQIGDRNELKANADITQMVKLVSPYDKAQALLDTLKEYNIGSSEGRGLIFTATKRTCDQLERDLQRAGFKVAAIHGDKDQRQRDEALDNFRSGRVLLLVATDVAARGLDVKGVVLVLNYDPANNTEDYVHRIGRTGRAGQKGTAVTFLTSNEGFKAKGIIEVMEKTQQPVSEELRTLASTAGSGGKGGGRFRDGGRDDRGDRGDKFGRGGERGDRGERADRGDRGRDFGDRDRGDRGGGCDRERAGRPVSNPFSREENLKSVSPPRRSRSRRRRRSRSRSRRRRSADRDGRDGERRGRSRDRDRDRDRSRDRERDRDRDRDRDRSRDRSRCRDRDRSRSRRRRSRSRSRRCQRSEEKKPDPKAGEGLEPGSAPGGDGAQGPESGPTAGEATMAEPQPATVPPSAGCDRVVPLAPLGADELPGAGACIAAQLGAPPAPAMPPGGCIPGAWVSQASPAGMGQPGTWGAGAGAPWCGPAGAPALPAWGAGVAPWAGPPQLPPWEQVPPSEWELPQQLPGGFDPYAQQGGLAGT